MSDSLRAGRFAVALFLLLLFLKQSVVAKVLVSNKYGFQLSIPAGFREQSADSPNLIIRYAETEPTQGDYPITIDIRRTGPAYNPADRSAMSRLVGQNGWENSFQSRHWKELDLQVMRQEMSLSPSETYVNYAIIFPLKGEGIVVSVQGLKGRETEVTKVFDESVEKFVNLKPYAAVIASSMGADEGHSTIQVLINFVLSLVTVAIVFLVFTKARKARTQAV
jgi:hypothetical protein